MCIEMVNEEDLDLVEHHKEIMLKRFWRCILKVWLSRNWDYATSLCPANSSVHQMRRLEAEDISSAKFETELWALNFQFEQLGGDFQHVLNENMDSLYES